MAEFQRFTAEFEARAAGFQRWWLNFRRPPHNFRGECLQSSGPLLNFKSQLLKCSRRSLKFTDSILLPKRTAHPAARFDFDQFGNFGGTFRFGDRAARRETAARWEIADARDVSGNRRKPFGTAAQFRHGIHQRLVCKDAADGAIILSPAPVQQSAPHTSRPRGPPCRRQCQDCA